MAKEVKPSGPRDAKVAIIGEAPGREEDREGIPFVGMAGQELDKWIAHAGLCRDGVFIDNVLRERPSNNRLDTVELRVLQQAADDARRRIADHPANVVVAVGAYAWNAIRFGADGIKRSKRGTGFRESILKWRGSEVAVDIGNVTKKVIPVIHPSAILRTPAWRKRCLADFVRIDRESHTPGVYMQPWLHHTTPNLHGVEQWVQELYDVPPEAITFDIETPNRIFACFGFARSDMPNVSFTIPTTIGYWKNTQALARVWSMIGKILRSPAAKVTQNGLFDTYWLKRLCGFTPTNWKWDLMGMHHTLDPLEEHKLAFISSIYSPHYCYWKDEAKDEDSLKKYKGSMEALLTYNGMDCCRQIELFPILRDALKAVKL